MKSKNAHTHTHTDRQTDRATHREKHRDRDREEINSAVTTIYTCLKVSVSRSISAPTVMRPEDELILKAVGWLMKYVTLPLGPRSPSDADTCPAQFSHKVQVYAYRLNRGTATERVSLYIPLERTEAVSYTHLRAHET